MLNVFHVVVNLGCFVLSVRCSIWVYVSMLRNICIEVSDHVFLFRGRAPIASMDAMEDMEVFTGSNPGLAPVCQVKYLILSSSI